MMDAETTEVTSNEETLFCSNGEDDCYTNCPLFMQSLPADFGSHPALAALASLITTDEDEDDAAAADDDDQPPLSYVVIESSPSPHMMVTLPSAGGGKARLPKSRTRRQSEPYPKPKAAVKSNKNEKPSTTLGEAQLFLSLWKL